MFDSDRIDYPRCSELGLLEWKEVEKLDGIAQICHVPFARMQHEKFEVEWAKWANRLTCYPFGYFPWDVEDFLAGKENTD